MWNTCGHNAEFNARIEKTAEQIFFQIGNQLAEQFHWRVSTGSPYDEYDFVPFKKTAITYFSMNAPGVEGLDDLLNQYPSVREAKKLFSQRFYDESTEGIWMKFVRFRIQKGIADCETLCVEYDCPAIVDFRRQCLSGQIERTAEEDPEILTFPIARWESDTELDREKILTQAEKLFQESGLKSSRIIGTAVDCCLELDKN